MTTKKALASLPCFKGAGPRAIENVVRRLCEAGYLRSSPLFDNECYFHLTRRATDLLGLHPDLAKPLTEDQKIRAFAILSYCCLHPDGRRDRLTPEEFKRLFPGLYKSGQRVQYYVVNLNDVPRLGYLKVDRGGNGRWDRAIERCRGDMLKRGALPAFGTLIEERGFEMTLLTSLEQKAEQIRAAVAELDRPFLAPLYVYVVPNLIKLVAPIKY
jgi:hypothetical protein